MKSHLLTRRKKILLCFVWAHLPAQWWTFVWFSLGVKKKECYDVLGKKEKKGL